MPPPPPFSPFHVTFTNPKVGFSVQPAVQPAGPQPTGWSTLQPAGDSFAIGPQATNWIPLQPTDPEVEARRSQLQKHLAVLQSMGITDLSALGPMKLQSNAMVPKGLVSPRAPADSAKLVLFHNASQKAPGAGQFAKISGTATQLASQPLSASSAKVSSDKLLDVAYLAAEWLDFADGTNIILAAPNMHLVILTKKLTVGNNVTFTYERLPVSQPAKKPKPMPKPAKPSKPESFSDGTRGTNGASGDPGDAGASFDPAPTIEIWTLELNGSPAVDLRGQDGGQGGAGADGGDGGDGGDGSNGVDWGGSGPGNGGDGGDGGKAGDGGQGGNGGWGGQFTLYAPQSFLTTFSSTGFFISVDGGAAGPGGMPGTPGSGGSAGARGTYSNTNRSKKLDRHDGSPGHMGAAGKQGPSGNAGHQSVTNPTKLIAIGPDEFTSALAKPAIIDLSVQTKTSPTPPKGYGIEGDTVTITGKNFNKTDTVQMLDDNTGQPIPCNTVVSGDTLASFQIPQAPGGKRSFYMLQADGTKSNMDSVYIMPTLNHIEPGPRVRPGTTVKIFGTGFNKGARILITGQDGVEQNVGPTDYLDSHTLQAKVVRPRGGMPNDAAGEKVNFGVALQDLTPQAHSNMIPIVLDTYRILVFGDSVAWGCGLGDSEKFSTLVMNEVTNRNGGGIGVYKTVAAHTGAIIGNGNSGSGPEQDGEVPRSFPTILQQVSKWESIPDAKDVDLVLVDGGINDVKIEHILNIFDPTDIAGATEQHCHQDMKSLLSAIAGAFSTARVVVTGYFPILSDQSDQTEGKKFMSVVIMIFGMSILPPLNPAEWKTLSDRCSLFNSAAKGALAKAVSETNSSLGGPPRIFFADPDFGPANAVFASDACLFGVNGDLSPQDGMAGPRAKSCEAQAKDELNYCKHASLGHPNAKGALKYAQAIYPFL